VAEELERPCSGDHRHVVFLGGGTARRAQVHPGGLGKAIISGLRNQILYDGRLEKGPIGAVDATVDLQDFVSKPQDYENFTFYDDILQKKRNFKATVGKLK